MAQNLDQQREPMTVRGMRVEAGASGPSEMPIDRNVRYYVPSWRN